MLSHLFYYQLVLIALVWLCLILVGSKNWNRPMDGTFQASHGLCPLWSHGNAPPVFLLPWRAEA
jgi:hypothetical protein